jgi:hypothetical protein
MTDCVTYILIFQETDLWSDTLSELLLKDKSDIYSEVLWGCKLCPNVSEALTASIIKKYTGKYMGEAK